MIFTRNVDPIPTEIIPEQYYASDSVPDVRQRECNRGSIRTAHNEKWLRDVFVPDAINVFFTTFAKLRRRLRGRPSTESTPPKSSPMPKTTDERAISGEGNEKKNE